MFPSLFVVVLVLCYCSKESNQSFLGHPQLFGPSEALLRDIVELKCELPTHPKNESVLLRLFRKGDRTKSLGDSTSLAGEVGIFNLVIKRHHEGNLECVARLQNDTKSKETTVSNTHYLKVVEPVEGAKIVVHSGSEEFFEGRTLDLNCELTTGNHVSYKWLLNDQLISQSPFHIVSDTHLLIYRTTSKDSGSYVCVAFNSFNNTVFNATSSEVLITVKDVVSDPDISFTVLKEDSHEYSSVVTCQSTKGTPPITFSLYNRKILVANMTGDDRKAVFKVPLVLDQHMGWFQCWADNEDRIGYSQWLPLEVVPVGEPVKIHYDYDVGENYAVVGLRFYCKVEKGSHPRYEWFLNNTLLHDRGSFYYVVHQPPEQSILLLSVGRSSAGTYHCEVSDSFDNTTIISSKKKYLDKEVVNRLPVYVVAIVFASFTFLIFLVSGCCWIGVVFRRRQFGKNSLSSMEMQKRVAAYEGELDVLEFDEGDELVKTTSGDDDFDQVSEASVDEWPQIIEEKKTLEDEPIEFPRGFRLFAA